MGFFDFLFLEEKSLQQLRHEAHQYHKEEELKSIPILERRLHKLVNKGIEIDKKIDILATRDAKRIIKNGEIKTYKRKIKINSSLLKLIHEYEKIRTSDYRWNDRKKKLWLEILIHPRDSSKSHYENVWLQHLIMNKEQDSSRRGFAVHKDQVATNFYKKDWESIYIQNINDQVNMITSELEIKDQKKIQDRVNFRNAYLGDRKKIEKEITKVDRLKLHSIVTPAPNPAIKKIADKRWGWLKKDNWQILKKQNQLYKKWDKERNELIKNKQKEEGLKNLFINAPVDPIPGTGDNIRFNDFNKEINNDKRTSRYLYLVKIKSRIDDKSYVKIGLTSKNNIDKRFDLDDVVDLIETYRLVKLNSRVAMALEYNLIRKYRPKGYIAEKEFDQFSRFSGYTEIIPMRRTTDVCQDIDNVVDDLD